MSLAANGTTTQQLKETTDWATMLFLASCAWAVIAVACAGPSAETIRQPHYHNIVPQSDQARMYTHSSTHMDSAVASTLAYNVTMREGIVSLDQYVHAVERVTCGSDWISIRLAARPIASGQEQQSYDDLARSIGGDSAAGRIVTGGTQWGCLGTDGLPDAFQRRLLTGDVATKFHTNVVSFMDCFDHATIHFTARSTKQKKTAAMPFTFRNSVARNTTETSETVRTRQNQTRERRGSVQRSLSMSIGPKNFGLYQSGPFDLSCQGCSVSVVLDIAFRLEISYGRVKLFSISISESLRARVHLKLDVSHGSQDFWETELPTGLSSMSKAFAFSIYGPVSTMIRPNLALYFKGRVNSRLQGQASGGVQLSLKGFRQQLSYTKNGGWSSSRSSPALSVQRLPITQNFLKSQGSVDLRVYIMPRVSLFLFNGLVEFYAQLEPFVGIQFNIDPRSQTCLLTGNLQCGVEGSVGIEDIEWSVALFSIAIEGVERGSNLYGPVQLHSSCLVGPGRSQGSSPAPPKRPLNSDGDCSCNGRTNANGRGGADCRSTLRSRKYCYTRTGACSDGKSSSLIKGSDFSYIACASKMLPSSLSPPPSQTPPSPSPTKSGVSSSNDDDDDCPFGSFKSDSMSKKVQHDVCVCNPGTVCKDKGCSKFVVSIGTVYVFLSDCTNCQCSKPQSTARKHSTCSRDSSIKFTKSKVAHCVCPKSQYCHSASTPKNCKVASAEGETAYPLYECKDCSCKSRLPSASVGETPPPPPPPPVDPCESVVCPPAEQQSCRIKPQPQCVSGGGRSYSCQPPTFASDTFKKRGTDCDDGNNDPNKGYTSVCDGKGKCVPVACPRSIYTTFNPNTLKCECRHWTSCAGSNCFDDKTFSGLNCLDCECVGFTQSPGRVKDDCFDECGIGAIGQTNRDQWLDCTRGCQVQCKLGGKERCKPICSQLCQAKGSQAGTNWCVYACEWWAERFLICPAGTFIANPASVECVPCSPGTHQPKNQHYDQDRCQRCDGIKWYQDKPGAASCKAVRPPCNPTYEVENRPATRLIDRTCKAKPPSAVDHLFYQNDTLRLYKVPPSLIRTTSAATDATYLRSLLKVPPKTVYCRISNTDQTKTTQVGLLSAAGNRDECRATAEKLSRLLKLPYDSIQCDYYHMFRPNHRTDCATLVKALKLGVPPTASANVMCDASSNLYLTGDISLCDEVAVHVNAALVSVPPPPPHTHTRARTHTYV